MKFWRTGTQSHPHNSSHPLGVLILSLESSVVPLWDSCSWSPPSCVTLKDFTDLFVTPFHDPEAETFCAY